MKMLFREIVFNLVFELKPLSKLLKTIELKLNDKGNYFEENFLRLKTQRLGTLLQMMRA